MIVSSVIVEDARQIDGRRHIRELHTDDSGAEYHVAYMADPKVDAEEILPIRAAQIEQQITDRLAADQARVIAEKERAAELLKLGDESIAKILMVSPEKVAEEKAILTADATTDVSAEAAK